MATLHIFPVFPDEAPYDLLNRNQGINRDVDGHRSEDGYQGKCRQNELKSSSFINQRGLPSNLFATLSMRY
jgi:hypothetical protein